MNTYVRPTHCILCGDERYGQDYDEKTYCKKHYDEKIFFEFYSLYNQWVMPNEPSKRLKYLIGRIVDEYFSFEGSYLSAARVRDRGYNFEKVDDHSFTFEIERHPGAFKSGGDDFDTIVQKWLIDMSSRHAKVINDTRNNFHEKTEAYIHDVINDEEIKNLFNFNVRKVDDEVYEITEFVCNLKKLASNFEEAKSIVDDCTNQISIESFYYGHEDKNIMFTKEELIETLREKILSMFEDAWKYMDE
jgi:hypothetical protein